MNSTVCSHCGSSAPANAHFCPQCGYALVQKISCKHCGQEIKKDDLFCIHCGKPTFSQESDSNFQAEKTTTQSKDTYVKKCSKCGELINESLDECPHCHYRFTQNKRSTNPNEILCPSCNATINEFTRVCPECGCRLGTNKLLNTPKQPLFIPQHPLKSQGTKKGAVFKHSVIIAIIIGIILICASVYLWTRNKQPNINIEDQIPQNEQTESPLIDSEEESSDAQGDANFEVIEEDSENENSQE